MDEVNAKELPTLLLKRAWRIRLRMMVERISGVPAENKQVFLSQCLLYEKMLQNEYIMEAEELLCGGNGSHNEWKNWGYSSEDEERLWSGRDWGDWDDWHKLNIIFRLAARV